MRALIAALLLLVAAPAALAHPAPNSEIHVQMAPGRATARLLIPLEELSVAMGQEVTAQTVAAQPQLLEAYLRAHVAIRSGAEAWPVAVLSQAARQQADHPMLEAVLRFTAPEDLGPGAVFAYDAVTHQVMSHFALAYVSDAPGVPARPLARFQSPLTEAVLVAATAPAATVTDRSGPSLPILAGAGVLGLALIAAALRLRRRRPP